MSKQAILIAVGCLFARSVAGQELTAANYERLRDQIDVKPDELRWQKVEWLSFWDGLVEAQAKDKPIFYWIYFGDPRGGC
jgi:hypothetical protein